jgi:hypothetical protein
MVNKKAGPTVKARRQGTSLAITIPAQFGVAESTEYVATRLPDGTLQYVPVPPTEFPPIWDDDAKLIKAFNASIGSQDDGVDYGREYVPD